MKTKEQLAKEYSNSVIDKIRKDRKEDPSHNIGYGDISEIAYKIGFDAGAEFALREAIEICNKRLEQNFQYIKSKGNYVDPNTFNLIQEVRRVSMALQFIVKEIEQFLSSEDKNDKP